MTPKPIKMRADRQEMKHSISGFEMACYTSEFSKRTYDYVDWHWHTEFQLCLVTKGAVCFRVDDRQYEIKRGDGIFINSQSVHMAKPHQCEEAAYFCMDFHPNMICRDCGSSLYRSHLLPALGGTGLSAVALSADHSLQNSILITLDKMRMLDTEKRAGFELELVIGVLIAWKSMIRLLPECDVPQGSAENNRLKQIILLIQESYAETMTLNRIAEHIHLSRSECCRYFRKTTGQTLFAYLTQYRIDRSIGLLLQTDMRISQIALEVGFSSQSYYTKCFKKAKNMTPGEFRTQRKSNGLVRQGAAFPPA